MKKYVVVIEETVACEFEVTADNSEAALSIAEERYKTGEIILEPGEVQHKQMAVMGPVEENAEFVEF